MLGWLYLGLYGLIVTNFVPKEQWHPDSTSVYFGSVKSAYWGCCSLFHSRGMARCRLVFPPCTFFAPILLPPICGWISKAAPGFSRLLLRSSLAFMVLSTFGVWSMGPLMAWGFKHSIWYHLAVQFFLHFQFNGWFIIALLALFFRWMEQKGHLPSKIFKRWFYGLLLSATFLTFALAVAWSEPHPLVFACNSIGVLLQLAALVLLFRHLWPIRTSIQAALAPVQFAFGNCPCLVWVLK